MLKETEAGVAKLFCHIFIIDRISIGRGLGYLGLLWLRLYVWLASSNEWLLFLKYVITNMLCLESHFVYFEDHDSIQKIFLSLFFIRCKFFYGM